ncbi:MAG: AtpZ/AtpI family protein [Aquificaceae bacterium]|nr:AtpZ/AtpI family protein [Aquificaceae bacterium]
MKSKDFLAMTLGLHLVGGVIAGLLLGYAFDKWLMEGFLKIRSFPLGLFLFLLLGVISGFLNAYRDLRKIQ